MVVGLGHNKQSYSARLADVDIADLAGSIAPKNGLFGVNVQRVVCLLRHMTNVRVSHPNSSSHSSPVPKAAAIWASNKDKQLGVQSVH